MKYYAIAKGKKPGIYTSWDECKNYVHGFSNAKYKSFPTIEQAEAYYAQYHSGAKPKNQDYKTAKEIKYKSIDNCLICEKPFKQKPAKNGNKKENPFCPSCQKKYKELRKSIYIKTNGQIKWLSKDDLVYLNQIYKNDNIFKIMEDNPMAAIKIYQNENKISSHKILHEQRISYNKDSSVKGIPPFIKDYFGQDKEVIKVEDNKRNPKIMYHCKKCDTDYSVYWNHYKKSKSHDCKGLISSGEIIVENYLKENNINYTKQRKTLKCINPDTGYVMPYDFELTGENILIEVQGDQHRRFIECFHVDQEGFLYQQKKDKYKKEFAESNGYILLELWYEDFNDDTYKNKIQNILKKRHNQPS